MMYIHNTLSRKSQKKKYSTRNPTENTGSCKGSLHNEALFLWNCIYRRYTCISIIYQDACLCQFAETVTILHLDGQWYLFCTFINALWSPFKASVAFYGNLISTITREYSISLNAPLKSSWQIKRIFLSTVKNKCSIDN